MRIFHKYNELLMRRPFTTNMISTSLFFGTGDLVAQLAFPHKTVNDDGTEEKEEFQPARTARAMTYGAFFFAPLSVIWHRNTLPYLKNPLISHIRRQMMESTPKLKKRLHLYDTVFRVSIDQLFVVSFVWIPLYNTVMTTLAGHPNPLQLSYERLKNNWWTVLKASWTIWPVFMLFNLYFVPIHLRIVAANFWSIGWNAFLSFIHNSKGHGKGSGKLVEELVDIEDEKQEITMVYD